jgi:hypothetical protein
VAQQQRKQDRVIWNGRASIEWQTCLFYDMQLQNLSACAERMVEDCRQYNEQQLV